MARPKKSADQSTTVSVSLRIDPRIKYGIDLAARIQKRTVTGVVEWAVEQALADVSLPRSVFAEHEDPDAPTDLASSLDDRLWSSNEGVRLVLLASRYPQLLSYEETRIWETIKLSPPFWHRLPRSAEDCSPWENAKLSVIADSWPTIIEIVESRKDVVVLTNADIPHLRDRGLTERMWRAVEEAIGEALSEGDDSREPIKVPKQDLESFKSKLHVAIEQRVRQEESDQD
ncbi:hypothetical protein D3C76_465360 [compost metagenome]|uniref:hypothetical protein n=1 Tax=Pseudomonas sp. ACN8 TaxID=1920428 RepID=UPI000BB31A7E|nr:hypothetical protein [Pseudomonas sp. ACN8]